MKEIQIKCDRCQKVIDAIMDEESKYIGGFYDVSNSYWTRFANYGENKVCDDCMHSDPRYKEVYNIK